MRQILTQWLRNADALQHVEQFKLEERPELLDELQSRADDLYITLIGELFKRIREDYAEPETWARLGNAFGLFVNGLEGTTPWNAAINRSEAALFATAAFYFGGFPASAYLMLKRAKPVNQNEAHLACYDLLARPKEHLSETAKFIEDAIRRDDKSAIERIVQQAKNDAQMALQIGPEEWISARLLHKLLERFSETNIRAVLPTGPPEFWNPLVESFLSRPRRPWDFFPSQIDAIKLGLLNSKTTYTLQMPTGAGKTALSETLLYYHLKHDPAAVAVLIVPFRALASELRNSLVPRLIKMGLPSQCAYGGTVPSGDEKQDLNATRVLIATPEALSGLLTANPEFFQRISLVICDEGHLLDSAGRGVLLELLLTRMKIRESGPPRFVFISAIVPNVEEINAWLGGSDETVIRSTYRPTIADFSVLHSPSESPTNQVNLYLHPHQPNYVVLKSFLTLNDFSFTNTITNRKNSYPSTSIKARAIAAARKSLLVGASVVFAANKRGAQGAIGLAEELLNQLEKKIDLPIPRSFTTASKLVDALEYLKIEYGPEWIGTKALSAGAILHHGDVPQESREVMESLLRDGSVKLAICTSTLAEGVNLPIRTLVLYSVQRSLGGKNREALLTRDIKNLVGRAGRAGATTKGLVICANEKDWKFVKNVAMQAHEETVVGALHTLITRVQNVLHADPSIKLSNELMESETVLHSLIDGVDAILVDMAAEEIGTERLVEIAMQLVDETFAARQNNPNITLLKEVFTYRAQRIAAIHAAGKLSWIRETGAQTRLLESVETRLAPKIAGLDDNIEPTDSSLINALVSWAWDHPELTEALLRAYRVKDEEALSITPSIFAAIVSYWITGDSFADIATQANLPIDDLLNIHSAVLLYVLQTLIEQGIAILEKILESQGQVLAPALKLFPELLRFGVPTEHASILMQNGVRHRRAAVYLGNELLELPTSNSAQLIAAARTELDTYSDSFLSSLGSLVKERTEHDLKPRKTDAS